MMGIDDAVAAGSKLLDDAINKIWPNPEDKAKAEAMVLTASAQAAIGTIQANTAVLLAEAKSDHWLAACWRPIVMLTFAALIVARWCGFTAPGISEAIEMRLWDIVQFGMGGYVVGRSAEKTLPAVAAAVAQVVAKPGSTTNITVPGVSDGR